MAEEKNLTENATVAAENGDASWDFSNLENALQGLTANDYMFAERACRASGDTTPEMAFSSSFRARLAAKAMKIPYSRIQELGIREYTTVTVRVGNFLIDSLAKAQIQSNG